MNMVVLHMQIGGILLLILNEQHYYHKRSEKS